MTDASTQHVTDEVRAQAVTLLEQYIAGTTRLEDACHAAKKLTKAKWFRSMFDELTEYALPSLPASPSDTNSGEIAAQAAAKRVICLLQSGREYVEVVWLVDKVLNRVFISFMLICLMGVVLSIVVESTSASSDAAHRWTVVFAMGLGIGILFLALVAAISTVAAGIHIVRVRILRQDLSAKLDEDIWPYSDRALLDQDMATGRQC